MSDSDERFLIERNDLIDNAVFDALQALATNELEWDMSIIGEVIEFIDAELTSRGFNVCYPWVDENETICYRTSEKCSHCTMSCSTKD